MYTALINEEQWRFFWEMHSAVRYSILKQR